MQSLRNGDRPTWGHRADGGGLAGGAAVALAEKWIIPKDTYKKRYVPPKQRGNKAEVNK